MAVYLVLVALGRYFISGALEYDEAEQFLHAQFLLPGYGPQPPLFEWLIHGLFLINGTSFLALLLFKAAMLWVVFWAVGRIFLLLTGREDLAVAASYAVFLLPILSWAAPRTLTHTLLAMMFSALFVLGLLVRALPRRRASSAQDQHQAADRWWIAALALSAAGALLSKYSMAPVLLMYLLATLSVPQWRSRLWNWQIFAAAGLAGVIVAPHGWWVWTHLSEVRAPIMVKLNAVDTTASNGFLQSGGTALISGLLGFIALPTLVWAYLWVWNRFRFGTAGKGERGASAWSPDLRTAMLAYFAMFALFCTTIIFGPGTAGFRNRWLAPFLMLLPAGAVIWATVQPQTEALLCRLVTISRGLLVVAGIGLVLRVPLSGWIGKPGWANLPVTEIAHDVKSMTKPSALVLVANMQLAGSLEMRLEDRLTFEINSSVAALLKPRSCELLLVVPEPDDDSSSEKTAELQQLAARFLKQGEPGDVRWVAARRNHKYRFSDETLDLLYLAAKGC